MARLLPALAAWLRRGAKGIETIGEVVTSTDQPMQGEPMQGEPVLVGRPAVAAAATPSVPVRAPPQKTQSSTCVVL